MISVNNIEAKGTKPEVWDCCERNFSSKNDFELEAPADFEESHLYWSQKQIKQSQKCLR